jgi:hypothetical protein
MSTVHGVQLALSRLPGSLVAAIIGTFAGQMYRSELANLKSYRIPASVVRFARRYLTPLIGSTRPPRRTNRAFPDDTRSSLLSSMLQGQNEDVITTARPSSNADRGIRSDSNGTDSGTGSSVVREWVNELTGRTDRVGVRAPPEAEISQLMAMFPDVQREVVVGALQRR